MKNRKNDAKKSLYQRIRDVGAQGLAWSERDQVVLRGKKGATVHGCRKILQYSPVEIQLLLTERVVSIEGKSLYCTSFGAGSVTVEGDVRRATYLPESTE